MFSPDQLNTLIQDALSRLTGQNKDSGKTKSGKSGDGGLSVSPEQALVIAGLLGNILSVQSLLVDRDQNVEIVLVGTLKKKTQMDKLMDQMGAMPFDDVLKAFMGRLF